MRYKQLVTNKLDQLQNSLLQLQSILGQGRPRHEFEEWLEKYKEKIDEIQTLVNSENG